MTVESPHGRSRGRPKTFDRDRVVYVAIDSYWSEGTDGVSLNDLCRRAGVSKPGLYREFGGEDGLTDAVLKRYAETFFRPMLQHTTADRPFAEVLSEMVEMMTNPPEGQPDGCLFTKMRVLSANLGPTTQARVDELRAEARGAYARWVERAIARGEITTTRPVPTVAAFIDAEFTSLLTQIAGGEDSELVQSHAELAFAGLLSN